MPEIAKSPVAEMRDLREALRSSERVFFGGKPYRDAFCDIYDYAAELESAMRNTKTPAEGRGGLDGKGNYHLNHHDIERLTKGIPK